MNKKIKVLHVINALEIGGAEVLLSEILPKMDKKKFRNSVAYLLKKKASIDTLSSAEIEIFDLSWKGRFNPLIIAKLMALLNKIKPNIVHTHSIQSDFVGHLACMLRKFRNRVTTQHSAFHPKHYTLPYRLARTLTHRSATVIAVSDYCRKYLISELGYNSEIIKVVHNGIDVEKFEQKVHRNEKSRFIEIGTLGRLHAQKGLPTLIKAITYVKSNIDVLCYIPGTGELEGVLRRMVSELNLGDKVKFLGALNECEKIEYLQNLDIFVQPSRWEAFGISILEAMAVGLPVIASDLEGIPELVVDGETGILIKPNNEKLLAQTIISLSKNSELQETLGKNARKRASTFTIERVVSALERIYLNVYHNNVPSI